MKWICKRIGTGLLCLLMMLSAWELSAQERRISGVVKDAAGNPVQGVAVVAQGTNVGVVTGADGGYSINVPAGVKTLTFTFVGYETVEEDIGSKTRIDVVMKESVTQIESVVAIGYGVRKKTDLTGSVGSIEADEIVAKGTPQLMEALQGQVPGVNISASSSRAGSQSFSIMIRGKNSFDDTEPLYVVDGIVVDNIDYLNPNDVERVDVLKDASSTAIYGSRGSSGVILVTTKQAANVKKDDFSLTYDGSYGIKQIARTPEYMDNDDWFNYRLGAYLARGGSAADGETFTLNSDGANALVVGKTSFQRYLNGEWYDWKELGYKNSAQQSHTISISGNSGNTSYTGSLGYQNERGSYDHDEYNRANMRLGFDHKIKDIARVGIQTNLSMMTTELGAKRFIRDLRQANPLMYPWDEDGNVLLQPGGAAANGSLTGNSFTNNISPLKNLENSQENLRSFRVMGNAYIEITPLKGLTLRSQFSPHFRYSRLGYYRGKETQDRNSAGTNQAYMYNREYLDYTWDNSITYAGQTGDHEYDATFVHSIYSARRESARAEGTNLGVENFYGLTSAGTAVPPEASYTDEKMVSFIGRINYGYKSRYLLTASLRADGSSKFPKDRWRYFPSVAVAWRMTEENFLRDVHWLSNLKLRFSFGYSGNNANISPYESDVSPNVRKYFGFGDELALGYGPNGIANYDLTWEKTREFNAGVDFGFLNNRIRGTIDVYDRLSDGLLMSMQLPTELGVYQNVMKANVSSINNRGIEIGLSTTNIRTKNFLWTTSFTFSHNKNAIREIFGKKEDFPENRWFIGQPVDVAYHYQYEGVVSREDAKTPWAQALNLREGQAKIKIEEVRDAANQVTGYRIADRVIAGSADPQWIGNISSTFRYKNLDFSFNIYIDQGRYVASSFYQDVLDVGNRMRYKLNFDYYMPDEQNVTIGQFSPESGLNEMVPSGWRLPYQSNTSGTWPMPNNGGTYFVITGDNSDNYPYKFADVSYVKVKNITLGYTLPQQWVKHVWMKSLRVYMNVINPFVFTDYLGYDPEWASAGTNEDGPASVIWQFGISAKF